MDKEQPTIQMPAITPRELDGAAPPAVTDGPTVRSVKQLGAPGLFGVGGEDLAYLQEMNLEEEGHVAIFPSKVYGTRRHEPMSVRLGRAKDRVTSSRVAGLYRRASDWVGETAPARYLQDAYFGYTARHGADLVGQSGLRRESPLIARLSQRWQGRPEAAVRTSVFSRADTAGRYAPRHASPDGRATRSPGYEPRHSATKQPGRIGTAWQRTKAGLRRADVHFGVKESIGATGELIRLGILFGSMAVTRGLEIAGPVSERWMQANAEVSERIEKKTNYKSNRERFTALIGSTALLGPAIREASQRGRAATRKHTDALRNWAASKIAVKPQSAES